MSILAKALRQADDLRHLGPGVLRRAFSRPNANGYYTLHTRHGRFFYRRRQSDLSVIRQVYCQREYDLSRFPQWQGVIAAYADMLARDVLPLVIDCGANIGVSARWFAEMFPSARVLALEPDRDNARLALVNTEHLDNVLVIETAVGSESGRVKMQTFEHHAWAARAERSDAGISVATINNFTGHGYYSKQELLLVKIDIEGFESDLFAANTEWVVKAHCIIAEPHDWHPDLRGTSRNMMRVMGNSGCEMVVSGENLVWFKPS